MGKLAYSGSPQIRGRRTTRRIMIDVCIALLPACIVGCVYFGWGAAIVLAISTASAVVSEIVYRLCCRVSLKKALSEFDFSSAVTGLLVGMTMYSTTKWYVPMLASAFAIVVVKMLFGGTGKNIVNPAATGRAFAFISFGAAFGGVFGEALYPSQLDPSRFVGYETVVDGVTKFTGATPLAAIFDAGNVTFTLSPLDLLLGTGVEGTIGEVCKLALIVGGVYLVVRGVLNFRWPLVYMAVTSVVGTLIFYVAKMSDASGGVVTDFSQFAAKTATVMPQVLPVLWQSVLSGGLMLGAIFMATDYVTTPDTKLGNYIYFVALGVVTALLRWYVQGEAVAFAIMLMNLTVPLIDRYVLRRPFGKTKRKEAA